MQSENPATGEHLASYAPLSETELLRRIELSHATFLVFRRSDVSVRSAAARALARLLRERSAEYARLMALEMGKPIRQGRAEIEKCAALCDYFAEQVPAFLAPKAIETEASRSYVTYQALGAILAVMPWNFPFWQVFRFAVPAMLGGNTVLLKHAPNVCGCALAIETLFRDAGFSEGALQALLVDEALTHRALEHPAVVAVTCTGSPRAGSAVAEHAGRLIKPSVLELGGSDPYLILEDADLDAAARVCAQSRLINAGQSCIAAKRFIVVASRREAFERVFRGELAAAQLGDPLAETTDVGPLARTDLRDALHRQVSESVRLGARALLGGAVPEQRGAWYPVTLLANVKKGMPAYEEELFGPVAALIEAADEADAIRIANDSPYGLGAAVFTRDVERGRRIAETELDAGSCFVNALVRSDPRLPFGGIKQSGYGRELGVIGMHEFLNAKTVYVA